MKQVTIIFSLFAALWLSGCGGPAAPEERLAEYVDAWNKGDFDHMYTYFSAETKQNMNKEAFVERYEKLMNDLEIESSSVELPDEEDVQKDNDQTARLPFSAEISTIAGVIPFKKEAVMKLEETEEGEAWLIDWDPSYFLPELEEGDKVRIQTLKGERGRIFDRNGSSLAVNGTAVQIGATAGEMDDAGKQQLADVLQLSVEEINKELTQSWVQDGYFVPLKTVAETEEGLIQKAMAIQGATTSAKAVRVYPYGASAAHLTGYVGDVNAEELKENEGYKEGDQIGKRGLEQLFEKELRETDGVQIFIEKEKQEPIVMAKTEPQNGQDMQMTINAELQKQLYAEMDGEAGTASAVNPKTGEVLAELSSPSFDPNEFARGITGDRYKELQENPLQPLLNRFAAAYSPGSTIKPITAAVAMKAGKLDPAAGKKIEGLQWQKDSSWGNYRVTRVSTSAAPVTLESALVASDNIYFAMTALNTGTEQMKSGLNAFGFGEKFPFMYPLRNSQLSNSGEFDSDIMLADTGYGQGEVLTNMTHLASAYGTFLNGGTMMKPILLMEEDPSVWKKEFVTEEQAAAIRKGLRGVVEKGTAKAANIEGMSISGKTGTAEIKAEQGTTGKENGLFVAYDANQPDFVLALLVEDTAKQGGSKLAVDNAAGLFVKWKEY
jgi:cell division protein FtsI/penicillin-binding protein 2